MQPIFGFIWFLVITTAACVVAKKEDKSGFSIFCFVSWLRL